MMGYDIARRSNDLYETSIEKWKCRKEGRIYRVHRIEKDMEVMNLCKFQPRSLIKYINLQTALCGTCKNNNVVTRCSKEHLMRAHDVNVDGVHEISRKIADFVKEDRDRRRKAEKDRTMRLKRKEIMEYADNLIQSSLKKVKVHVDGFG